MDALCFSRPRKLWQTFTRNLDLALQNLGYFQPTSLDRYRYGLRPTTTFACQPCDRDWKRQVSYFELTLALVGSGGEADGAVWAGNIAGAGIDASIGAAASVLRVGGTLKTDGNAGVGGHVCGGAVAKVGGPAGVDRVAEVGGAAHVAGDATASSSSSRTRNPGPTMSSN